MSRLIDADALEDMDFETCDTSDWYSIKERVAGRNHIRRIVKDSPTVDAVAVCRCKDCKFGTSDHSGFVVCRMASYPNYTARNQNWYCADGEREGGNE